MENDIQYEINQSVPEFRFPEFDGEWDEKKLGDAFINSRKKGNSNLPIYSVSQEFGLIPRESLERNIHKDADSGLNLAVDQNDLVYNMMRMWQGAVGIASTDCMVSPAYIVIKPKGNVFSQFYYYLMSKKRSLYLFWAYSYGLTNDRLRLYFKDFARIKTHVPKLSEQKKISSFLSTIDKRLNLLQKRKDALKQYKEGVLRKINSQEIRFRDENGCEFPKWEKKKLSDCLDYIQPTKFIVKSTDYDNSFPIPVLTAGKSFILGYTDEEENIFCNPLPVIIFDDFTTSSHFVDFPFKVKSSAMKILIAKEHINIKFIHEAMNTIRYEIGGHERHWISKFAPMEIEIPSYTEQCKIADFLSALDSNINQTQTLIDKTELWKKGLLQKMFV